MMMRAANWMVWTAAVLIGLSGCQNEPAGESAAPSEDAAPGAAIEQTRDTRAPAESPTRTPPPPVAEDESRPPPAVGVGKTPLPKVDYSSVPVSIQMEMGAARQEATQSPDDPIRVSRLASLYYAQGFPEAAVECFKRLNELRPDDFVWQYCLAASYDKAGQREQALTWYRKALAQNNDYYPAHLRCAELLEAMGRDAEAQEFRAQIKVRPERLEGADILERAMLRNGLDHKTLINEAALAAQEGQIERADEYIEDALKSDLNDPQARSVRAMIRFLQGRTDEAVRELQDVLREHPDNLRAKYTLAQVRSNTGELDEGARLFREVLETEPSNLGAVEGLAHVFVAQGKKDAAFEMLAEAREQSPDDAELQFGVARICGQLDDAQRALEAVRAAIEIDPELGEAHYYLGVVQRELGDADAALDSWREAVRVDPLQIDARIGIIAYTIAQDDYAEALKIAEAGLEVAPGSVQLANLVGWVRATCSDPAIRDAAEAVKWAERANQLASGRDYEVLDTLAAAYAEAGRFVDARATISEAIRQARQHADAVQRAGNEAMLKRLRRLVEDYVSRLALYEQEQPYHEE